MVGFEYIEAQKRCKHPIFTQENRVLPDGRVYTLCTQCLKTLWEQPEPQTVMSR